MDPQNNEFGLFFFGLESSKSVSKRQGSYSCFRIEYPHLRELYIICLYLFVESAGLFRPQIPNLF